MTFEHCLRPMVGAEIILHCSSKPFYANNWNPIWPLFNFFVCKNGGRPVEIRTRTSHRSRYNRFISTCMFDCIKYMGVEHIIHVITWLKMKIQVKHTKLTVSLPF